VESLKATGAADESYMAWFVVEMDSSYINVCYRNAGLGNDRKDRQGFIVGMEVGLIIQNYSRERRVWWFMCRWHCLLALIAVAVVAAHI